ncbi:hypothetical protein [Gaopeijia maritima]|uniref:Uncharacterized protein n=1 Tax=Gaopeijia maritima TaxID=3119007 RepID=A0ABU9EC20_9BACT
MSLDQLVTALFASIGSGAAAYLGFRVGMVRFRAERAHDARIDWYLRMAEILAKMAGGLNLLTAAFRARDRALLAQVSKNFGTGLSQEYAATAREAPLFASKTTLLRLRYLSDLVNEWEIQAEPDKQEVIRQAFHHAHLSVVAEARTQMGLEPVANEEMEVFGHSIDTVARDLRSRPYDPSTIKR